MDENKKIAVIRIRGVTGVETGVNDTLSMLRLYRKNYCVVVQNNPAYAGMLKKAKDYITWGEINDEVFKLLIDKRGEEYKGEKNSKVKDNDFFVVNNKKIKKFFRLHPPKKGFERKGIKVSFISGGALGYRGDKINDLIKRMI